MERAISPLRLCASAGDMLLSLAAGLPFEAASAKNGSPAASVAAPLCGALRRRVQRDGYTER